MSGGAYYGYTAEELKIVAGTTVALTVAPLALSPVDGWGIHRFAFALVSGALAAAVGLALHR